MAPCGQNDANRIENHVVHSLWFVACDGLFHLIVFDQRAHAANYAPIVFYNEFFQFNTLSYRF